MSSKNACELVNVVGVGKYYLGDLGILSSNFGNMNERTCQ